MQVYRFPCPSQVEKVKEDYKAKKPKEPCLTKEELGVLQHSGEIDRILAQMDHMRANARTYGPAHTEQRLLQLKRSLIYHAARLEEAHETLRKRG
jgi:hypothetical protein